MQAFEPPKQPIRVAVSACLLGHNVRYDGGHKRDDFINDSLSQHWKFQALCPEVGIGMGVPRPPIHLINIDGLVRVRGVKAPESDYTDALNNYADSVEAQVSQCHGYILKSRSPSCGLLRVKIHAADARSGTHTSGQYTARLQQTHTDMPMEEEGRLHDPILRENFIARVYAYARWRDLQNDGISKASLLRFHTRHKLMLLAHNEAAYRRLGQLVAQMPAKLDNDYLQRYQQEFMQALQRRATRKRHTNVLQHVLGYFKKTVDESDRHELSAVIDQYRLQQVALQVPMTLLRHHLRKAPDDWLAEQYYFAPYPAELGLRNTI